MLREKNSLDPFPRSDPLLSYTPGYPARRMRMPQDATEAKKPGGGDVV